MGATQKKRSNNERAHHRGNNMSIEIAIMHCVFSEFVSVIDDFISSYLNDRREIHSDRLILEQFEWIEDKINWRYRSKDGQPIKKNNSPWSMIQIKLLDHDFHNVTEVKITCSDDDFLTWYFQEMADKLWESFTLSEWKLYLPRSNTEPLFKSRIEYADYIEKSDFQSRFWFEPKELSKQEVSKEISVPTRNAELIKWKKTYPVLKMTRKEFLTEWENGGTTKSKPTYDDYRDALRYKGLNPYGNETIKKILEAGDARML